MTGLGLCSGRFLWNFGLLGWWSWRQPSTPSSVRANLCLCGENPQQLSVWNGFWAICVASLCSIVSSGPDVGKWLKGAGAPVEIVLVVEMRILSSSGSGEVGWDIKHHNLQLSGTPDAVWEPSALHPCRGATTLWCQSELGSPGKWDFRGVDAQGRVSTSDGCRGNLIDESDPAVLMCSLRTREVPINYPGSIKPSQASPNQRSLEV